MCGIVAVLQREGGSVDRDLVLSMTRRLVHRGPDDEGTFFDDPVGLGFRRLAILDLTSSGHQPMVTPDGSAVLVFNGEIFNYVELRDELRTLGHTFRSTGDAEVLLQSYMEWGTACVERFNGEWAFMIYDRARRVLFGSRDRFGIKPLYRIETPTATLWASEIKALLAFPGYRPAINWDVAADFLRGGNLDHTSGTFFREIEPVPAATAFEVPLDAAERRWRYWSLPAESRTESAHDPAGRFAEIFEDAVRVRLRSDVPVGVCLSGGLDSTAVLCAMARAPQRSDDRSAGPLRAFSYHHDDFNERPYVDATVEEAGAALQRLLMDHKSLWQLTEDVIRAHDEPVHTLTAMVGFELMRMIAGAGVTVILNGQGADESLGGYDSYFRDAWYSAVRQGRPLRAWREIRRFTAAHGGRAAELFSGVLVHTVKTEFRRLGWYRALARFRARRALRERGWFAGRILEDGSDPGFEPLDLRTVLHRSMAREPLPLYLRVEDRNSMAHSVEVRLPLLDYRLIELAFSLDNDWKVRGEWNKYVLREAMRDRIPETVRTRVDKMGFPSPTRDLLRDETRDALLDIIGSQAARERGIYNTDKILRELRRPLHGPPDFGTALSAFRIAQFEIWARSYGV
jgi:asparagine synthase (glutamine-hydrolysing)